MSSTEILERLLPIIVKYLPDDVDIKDITPEKDLMRDLRINSAYLIDIVIAIEEAFEIRIEDHEIAQMNTVKQSIDMVTSKTAS